MRYSNEPDAFLDAMGLYIEPLDLYCLWRPRLRDPVDEMVLEGD